MVGLGKSFAHLKRSIDTKEQQVNHKVPLEGGPTPNGKSLNSCGFVYCFPQFQTMRQMEKGDPKGTDGGGLIWVKPKRRSVFFSGRTSLTMQCIDYFLPFCTKPTHHQTGPQTGEHYFQTGLLELSPPEKEFSDEYVFIIHHLTE